MAILCPYPRRATTIASTALLLRLLVSPSLDSHFAHSFVPSPLSSSSSSIRGIDLTTSTTTTLHIFGGLKDAFSNDDSLGKAKDAGLSSGPKYNDNVSVNGVPISKVVVDQKISLVCNAARVKVPYNCQNGECGTCTVKMNGKKVRACVAKVPSGKCAIQTL
jgi:ferredoxin